MSTPNATLAMHTYDQQVAALKLLLAKNPSGTTKEVLESELANVHNQRKAWLEAKAHGELLLIAEHRHQRRAAKHARRTAARAKILATAKGLNWDRLNRSTQQRWIHATGWIMHPGVNPAGSFYDGVDIENPVEYKAAVVADHLDREQEKWSSIPQSRQVEWRNVARAILKLR